MDAKSSTIALIAGSLALYAGTAADASLVPGSPITLEQTSSVSVGFVSVEAGATGSLYFLGWQPTAGSISYAPSSDASGLGQFIFSNHNTPAGTSVALGDFGPGTLHFAYLVTNGVNIAPTGSLFRTDIAGDEVYFGSSLALESPIRTFDFGIEDIRDPSKSDWDYNDLVVTVSATPVPTPGAAGIAVGSLGLCMGRRRRR